MKHSTQQKIYYVKGKGVNIISVNVLRGEEEKKQNSN